MGQGCVWGARLCAPEGSAACDNLWMTMARVMDGRKGREGEKEEGGRGWPQRRREETLGRRRQTWLWFRAVPPTRGRHRPSWFPWTVPPPALPSAQPHARPDEVRQILICLSARLSIFLRRPPMTHLEQVLWRTTEPSQGLSPPSVQGSQLVGRAHAGEDVGPPRCLRKSPGCHSLVTQPRARTWGELGAIRGSG